MRLEEFPGCCTARVLFDFGGSADAMHRGGVIHESTLEKEYDSVMEEYDVLADLDDEEDYDDAEGNAVMVATTTTEQEVANKFLEGKGFLRVGPYFKPKHPDTGLYLWWKPIWGMFGEEG